MGDGEGEKIYADWDCPEIEAVQDYSSSASTEMTSLSSGLSEQTGLSENKMDVKSGERMKVMRKLTASGWYFVEKSSDGQKGWIPMSFAKEIIESDHNRAKNYKKRHEFLKYLSTLEQDQNN